jgi:hypothetical protein
MGEILNALMSAGKPLSKMDMIKMGVVPNRETIRKMERVGFITKEEKYAENTGNYMRNEEGKLVPRKGTRYFVYTINI